MVGRTFGAYHVIAKLGEGGMGEVYRARDTRLGRDVALKVLPDSFAADPERVARFEREAQILAALSHANIAAIYGLEISGPTRVLVMQLVDGESLEARLRRGPLPPEEAIAIARQIGDALSAAHERGIVHRDLKPGNIMLTPDGSVKVLDFGLARMVEPDAAVSGLSMSPTLSIQATMAGTVLGTAPYMSPEQARGRTVDKRTDVWAFGCVLYEMLTGTRAFGGDDLTETIATIVKGDADWTALEAVAPAHIVTVVRGCLVKEPRERYADIAVPMHLLTTAAPVPGIATVASAATPPLWRRALPVAAVAIVAALLTAGAAWYMRPSPAPAAVTRFSIPLGDVTLTNTGGQAVAISPDGSRIVYTANRRLYVRSMADPEPRLISGLENVKNYMTRPAISPDGSEVVFWNADNASLTRVAIAGGAPVTVCQTDLPTGVRWESDGILFGLVGKGIFKVPAAGGAPQLVAPAAPDENASSPQSLPGGRGLLYSLKKSRDSWDEGRIVVKTAAGDVKTILEKGADGRYDGAGRLLYAVSGIVMAIPFDLDRLATTGPAVPVISGVLRFVEGNNSGVAQYSIAANGTLVFVSGPTKVVDGSERALLAVFDDKGNVTRLPIPAGLFRGIRVSPDARTVAYDSGSDPSNIWLQDLDGKTASRRLTFAGNNTAPVWSPDNKWIAFRSDREGDEAIFRQHADGTGAAERLTKPDAGTKHTPHAWSPDGARLVYEIEKDGIFQLHVLTLADRTSVRFSDVTSAVHMEPALSPDGRWLVYQRSDQSVGSPASPNFRGLQALVEPFPGAGSKYLVPVTPVAGQPQWSRAGDRLIINAAATSSIAVDFHASSSIAFGRPTDFPRLHRTEPNPLTGRRNSDAMPDGKLLGISIDLAVDGEETRRDQVNVILNWHQTLGAK